MTERAKFSAIVGPIETAVLTTVDGREITLEGDEANQVGIRVVDRPNAVPLIELVRRGFGPGENHPAGMVSDAVRARAARVGSAEVRIRRTLNLVGQSPKVDDPLGAGYVVRAQVTVLVKIVRQVDG